MFLLARKIFRNRSGQKGVNMKRNFLLLLFTLSILFVTTVTANGQSDKNISVDLVLNSAEEKVKAEEVSATLIIRNTGSTLVKAVHPSNRMAVAFIVLNSLGNVIAPMGIAKINPMFREITIEPNSEVKHFFSKLEFITGSALFGYELKTGETYRIIAIYRPDGKRVLV
jgi:hypothetical protein